MAAIRSVFVLAILVGSVACTPVDPGGQAGATASVKPHPPQMQPPQRPTGQVITTLQTRDHEVTIYATDVGPMFTVAASGGTVLAERLTTAEFRQSFPGLHQRYDSAFAEDGTQLDASLTLSRDQPMSEPSR